jgi:hypothetical protein
MIRRNLEPESNTGRTDTSSDQSRVNDEDNLDTREIAHNIEEGDEDYDDEELEREGDLNDEDEADDPDLYGIDDEEDDTDSRVD